MSERVAPPPEDCVLVLTRVLSAPRELVFEVWTRPEHVTRWWGPNNFTLPFCELDFRIGGSYRYCMRSPEGVDHWVWGTFREIVHPERIVFTWDRVDPDGTPRSESVVTLTFEDVGGKTRLTLHQATFKTVFDRDDHRGGWTECLDRMERFVLESAASN